MNSRLQAILVFLYVLSFNFDICAQSCSITSKANDIIPDKLCAPVTVTWDVVYRGVRDGGTGNVEMEFDWNDGSSVETIPANLTNSGKAEWSVSHVHVYPIGGDQCNYHPTVALVVDGNVCTGTMQEQIVTVWDTDDENRGQMSIFPSVLKVCVGNSGGVTFKDTSRWNCVPPNEDDLPNDHKRWIQWIYGTNSVNGNFIDNATVDGIVRTYPYAGSIDVTSEPIVSPQTPWNEALAIVVPNDRAVGDEFEVTLNNWNYCNPYDQGNDPVTTTVVVIVVDEPDGSIIPAGPFCENDAPVALRAVTPGGRWSGLGIVNQWTGQFDPSLAGEGTHTINYYVENGVGCSDNGTFDIQVLASPSANIRVGTETHLCPGIRKELDGNPTLGMEPYTHLWTGDVGMINTTTDRDPVFETVLEGSYDFVYRVTDNNGCYDEDTILLEIDTLGIRFLNKEVSLCTGSSTLLNSYAVGEAHHFISHQWSGDRLDLLSATDIEHPLFLSSLPGLYKYEYRVIDVNGCEGADSISVHVYERPVSNAGLNDMVCGLSYQLKATESAGVGTWSLVSGVGAILLDDENTANSLVTVDAYGDYTFVWTEDNNGCTSSSEVTVSFVEIPQSTVKNDADTCGLTYVLSATQDVGVGSWKLISGAGSVGFADTLNSATHVNVSVPGNYELAWLVNNNGCITSDTIGIDFYPVPGINVVSFDTEQCSPAVVEFDNTSTDADAYFWDFGDGYISNRTDPVHSFGNNTTDPIDYVVELIAYNGYGCVDTGRFDMRVLPTAVAAFKNDKEPGCSPLALDFLNQSEGATSYEWDFGDGEGGSQEHGSHTFINQEHYVQSFDVTLIANNAYACRDTLVKYVSVYPLVKYGFSATPQEGCHPLKVKMEAEPGAFSYQWDFDDGNISDGANVATHVFENQSGVSVGYNVKLYTNSVFGCRDSSDLLVTVLPSPLSQFSLSAVEGCSPFVVDFENQSVGVSKSLWHFGDGAEYSEDGISDVTHTYINSEPATVSYRPELVVENIYGCKDSSSYGLNVFPKVTALISEGRAGCTPYPVSLLNKSTGAGRFAWNFGDGNTSVEFNGLNKYVNSTAEDQTYAVQMIAESPYGCSDTAYTEVMVYRKPEPSYSITPLALQMPQSTIAVSNHTLGASWLYNWDFGDGNTSDLKDPDGYTYGKSGEYEVWLKVSGVHCADSLMQIVRVIPNLPAIDYGPDAEGCPPLEVQFYNNTVDAHTYLWDFGDGNVSSKKDPKHIYYTPGDYKVSLVAEGPGGMSEVGRVLIRVYETPFADFEAWPKLVKLPAQVSFTNLSERAISYNWQFGDGQSSADHSLQYRYENAGIYDVILQATDANGCTDERTIRQAVKVEEAGSVSFPNAFTPNPAGSSRGAYTVGSSDNYVFYPFVHEGVVEYKLRIYTRWGELIFESRDIKVGWDGYHHDKICPGGVYVWKVRCRYSNGSIDIKTGDVTLFR